MSTLSSTLPSSLKFLLLLSHILYSITSTTSSPYTFIYGGCSRIKYNSNQQYENNVNSLLTTLVNSASSAPFTKFTTGAPASPLYGAYQCRGDLTQHECAQCVQHALSALGNLCPGNCGAEVQLEGCFVKYDNATFLGVADKTVVMKKCGGGGGGDEVERVLGYVASRDGLYYRVGEVGRVRGVAQCVGDLSPSQCQSCVGYAVQRFRSDCGSVGSGDMFLAKCYVRISSNGGSNGSSQDDEIEKTLSILVGLIAGVALLIVLLSFLRKLCEGKDGK